jgi:hypothetical protein
MRQRKTAALRKYKNKQAPLDLILILQSTFLTGLIAMVVFFLNQEMIRWPRRSRVC